MEDSWLLAQIVWRINTKYLKVLQKTVFISKNLISFLYFWIYVDSKPSCFLVLNTYKYWKKEEILNRKDNISCCYCWILLSDCVHLGFPHFFLFPLAPASKITKINKLLRIYFSKKFICYTSNWFSDLLRVWAECSACLFKE